MANIPTTRNNPGDTKVNGQIATYNTPAEGQAALYNDLTTYMTKHPEYSLYDFSQKYAPKSDGNDPAQYAANLANQMKVSPDTPIKTLAPRIDEFAKAVAHNEGYQAPGQVAGDSSQSQGGIPITPLGSSQDSQSSGGIPITPLQIPDNVQKMIQDSKTQGSTVPGLLTGTAQGVTDTLGLHGAVDTIGGELAPILNAIDPSTSFKQKVATSQYLTPPNPLEAGKAGAQVGVATAIPEGIGDLATMAKPAVAGGLKAAETYAAANPIKSAIMGYIATNLLKNTKIGNTIENVTGIKGLLDLL